MMPKRMTWLAPILVGLTLGQLLTASPISEWAQLLMSQKEYARVVFLLKDGARTFDEKMLLAEAYRALGDDREALRLYRSLYENAPTNNKDHLLNEIFFAHVALNDIGGASRVYDELLRREKNVSAKVHYAFGRELFSHQRYDEAAIHLARVGLNNPFSMRSHYLLASMDLKKNNQQVLKTFNAIRSMPLLSTEDYAVKELSTLATARLWQGRGKHYEAGRVYQEVRKEGVFGDMALIEAVEGYLKLSEDASLGLDAFRTAPKEQRQKEAANALAEAVKLLDDYQKKHPIDVNKPKLFLLLIRVLEKSERYNDARLAADFLVKYFGSIETEFLTNDFAAHLKKELDLEKNIATIFPYLPTEISGSLPIITTLLEMKKSINANKDKLRDLKQEAKSFELANAHNKLAELSENQRRIEEAYYREIGRVANDLRRSIRAKTKDIVREAQFLRAQVSLKEYSREKAKLDALRTYNAQRVKEFEDSVEEGAR